MYDCTTLLCTQKRHQGESLHLFECHNLIGLMGKIFVVSHAELMSLILLGDIFVTSNLQKTKFVKLPGMPFHVPILSGLFVSNDLNG